MLKFKIGPRIKIVQVESRNFSNKNIKDYNYITNNDTYIKINK